MGFAHRQSLTRISRPRLPRFSAFGCSVRMRDSPPVRALSQDGAERCQHQVCRRNNHPMVRAHGLRGVHPVGLGMPAMIRRGASSNSDDPNGSRSDDRPGRSPAATRARPDAPVCDYGEIVRSTRDRAHVQDISDHLRRARRNSLSCGLGGIDRRPSDGSRRWSVKKTWTQSGTSPTNPGSRSSWSYSNRPTESRGDDSARTPT